jgi:hypothetical protein
MRGLILAFALLAGVAYSAESVAVNHDSGTLTITIVVDVKADWQATADLRKGISESAKPGAQKKSEKETIEREVVQGGMRKAIGLLRDATDAVRKTDVDIDAEVAQAKADVDAKAAEKKALNAAVVLTKE